MKILREFQAGREHEFYDPRVFSELKLWLKTLNEYTETKDRNIFLRMESVALNKFVADTPVLTEIEKAQFQSKSIENRRRQAAAFFDAFRSLKFIHYLRDYIYPSIPWTEALRNAPFIRVLGPIEPKTLFEVGRQLREPRVQMPL